MKAKCLVSIITEQIDMVITNFCVKMNSKGNKTLKFEIFSEKEKHGFQPDFFYMCITHGKISVEACYTPFLFIHQ